MRKYNIAFFASHGGSNMQAIIDEIERGKLVSVPALLITNNSKSGAVTRAINHNIPTYHISNVTHPNDHDRIQFLIHLFDKYQIDLVVLAGYMKKLHDDIIQKVSGKVLNIHPALLPDFGGEGMYGMNVHKAVIESGAAKSGATVHFVNSEYDRGKIILQESIEVSPDDNPESLAAKVLMIEHKIYPQAISMLENEEIGNIQ